MFGLVDGNNFYASVETSLDPRLIGKPVVILSSNDGCAIARSAEAKKLGVKMGQPIHEVPTDVRKQLVIRSANFGLYGDISGRCVSILRDLFPRVEVYSIDESFVTFEGIPEGDYERVCVEARNRIRKWLGITCCVGIGPTKTLAKAGNKLGKKTVSGVVSLADPDTMARLLADYPIEDLWGVGRKFAARLGAEGIFTAADLINADTETLRSRYGVVLSRTQMELRGEICTELQEIEPDRKQIVVSRSFGKETVELEDVQQAVATYAIRATEKLRSRSLKAAGLWVWLNTNPFKPDAPQYHPSKSFSFLAPTSDTREVLQVAQALVRAMHRKGYRYKKAGVGLLDLTHGDVHQGDLFAGIDPRSAKLMEVLDSANRKFGKGAMSFASSAWRPTDKGLSKPVWSVNRASLSPAYTSNWNELLKVR